MALNRFYLLPFRKGASAATEGFGSAQEAGAAAQDLLLNGLDAGSKVAVVKLMAVVELDNPVVKSTPADSL